MISPLPSCFEKFICCVGLVVFLKYSLCFICCTLNYIKSKVCLKNIKSYGKTVIVTGCTDGIGKALLYEFIKHDVDLLLISRNESELKNVKKDLIEKNKNFKGSIDYIVFDYNENNFASYKKIEAKIQNIDVGILVNNVGLSYPYPQVCVVYMNTQSDCVCAIYFVYVFYAYASCIYVMYVCHTRILCTYIMHVIYLFIYLFIYVCVFFFFFFFFF
uniref:17beta-estradiol 17-dehydrogenase n=1 Tax=Piliocolobus tephrosceles TaxID=591936 RepID=A0A8C9LL90_9PRIM